jgi:hypothetical protein
MHSRCIIQINPIRLLLEKSKFGAKSADIKSHNSADSIENKGGDFAFFSAGCLSNYSRELGFRPKV